MNQWLTLRLSSVICLTLQVWEHFKWQTRLWDKWWCLTKVTLSRAWLTYEKAVKLAKSHETATQDLKTQLSQTVGCLDNPRAEVTCYLPLDMVCHGCKRKGHLKRGCTKESKFQRPWKKSLHKVEEGSSKSPSEAEDLSGLHHVSVHTAACKSKVPPLQVTLRLDECDVPMELDTGASMSLISEETWEKLWPGRVLSKTKFQLCTYSEEPLPVLGCAYVNLDGIQGPAVEKHVFNCCLGPKS